MEGYFNDLKGRDFDPTKAQALMEEFLKKQQEYAQLSYQKILKATEEKKEHD